MDERLKQWVDSEMRALGAGLKQMKHESKKKMPLWMAVCILGMVGLGILVGADLRTILSLHLVIGLVFAAFVWLGFFLANVAATPKRMESVYIKSVTGFFQSEEDIAAFTRQVETGSAGSVDFHNGGEDSFPSRFTAGPDFLVYFRFPGCQFIRTADIQSVYKKQETTMASYSVGNRRVHQRMGIGVSCMIVFKEGSKSFLEQKETGLFLKSSQQYDQVCELMRRYCPGSGEFLS